MKKTFISIITGFLSIVMLFSISAVNSYAVDANIQKNVNTDYSPVDVKKVRSGDLNGDDRITSADARMILRIAAKLNSCSIVTFQYADTDGNGKVSATDARATLRVAANLDDISTLFEFELNNYGDSVHYDNIQAMSVGVGDSCTLDYFIIRGNSDDITWESSNPSAVTVDDTGKITAKNKGFSCIIASNGDETFYYEISVKTEIQQKIDTLRDKYPDGYYWNNHTPSKKYPDVTETPCDDHESGKYAYCKGQCAGFAALLFKEIYGYGDVSYGVTWDNVKIGDYLRLKKHHSVFVIDVINKGDITGYDYYGAKNITADEKYIVVAHCNWGWTCNIIWDDIFTPKYEIDSSQSYTKK